LTGGIAFCVEACDGEYLYLWTRGQGLKKLGTGKRGTIQGHVYCQNSNYRTDDDVASLALVANKLYYVSAGVGLPKSEKQISGQLTQVQQRQEQHQQQRPESEQFESLSSALQPISQLYSLDVCPTIIITLRMNCEQPTIRNDDKIAYCTDTIFIVGSKYICFVAVFKCRPEFDIHQQYAVCRGFQFR